MNVSLGYVSSPVILWAGWLQSALIRVRTGIGMHDERREKRSSNV
jgi:hypothetical protein